MRRASFMIAAALAVGVSATASAQTTTGSTANPTTWSDPGVYGLSESHWLAAGFAGASFGNNIVDDNAFDVESGTNVTFGGQIGYLWHGYVGAEALVDFTPSFKVPSNSLLADDPSLSSYMANGIVAAPFGEYGQFLPYFSAGIGVFHMSTNFVTLDPANSLTGSQGRFGGNIGAGFIGYAGNVGVRGDVRWYNVDVEQDALTASNARNLFTLGLLSGLEYWRANIGVAFRW